MKFRGSSLNGLKVRVGTKHAPKAISHQLFQSWGHNKIARYVLTFWSPLLPWSVNRGSVISACIGIRGSLAVHVCIISSPEP